MEWVVVLPRQRRLIRGYGRGKASPNPIPNPRQIIMARMAKLARAHRVPKPTWLPGQTTLPRLTSMADYDGRLRRRTMLARLYRMTRIPRLESWAGVGSMTCSDRQTRLKGRLS